MNIEICNPTQIFIDGVDLGNLLDAVVNNPQFLPQIHAALELAWGKIANEEIRKMAESYQEQIDTYCKQADQATNQLAMQAVENTIAMQGKDAQIADLLQQIELLRGGKQ